MKKLIRLSFAILALVAVVGLSSCGTTSGGSNTVKHYPKDIPHSHSN